MNLVYSKAHITIVAAAGSAATSGLPGVSTFPRVTQMETQVGGCTFLELPSFLASMRESIWTQRGWTYQEGLLSTRCLVFTDRGMFYHCRAGHSDECIDLLLPRKTTGFMKSYGRNNIRLEQSCGLQELFTAEIRDKDQLESCIMEYTKRHLSFSTDSLDAFLGVLGDYEKQMTSPTSANSEVPGKAPTTIPRHIWGLPLRDGTPTLEWHHSTTSKCRRPDFSSWSWAGWEGEIEFESPVAHQVDSTFTQSVFAPISFEMSESLIERATKFLFVTGGLVTLTLATRKQKQSISNAMKQRSRKAELTSLNYQPSSKHRLIEAAPGVFAAVSAYIDAEPKAGNQIFGLLVTHDIRGKSCHYGMIVLKQDSQGFTRIGYVRTEEVHHCQLVNIKGTLLGRGMISKTFLHKHQAVRQQICIE
jgi:hypothetical protein